MLGRYYILLTYTFILHTTAVGNNLSMALVDLVVNNLVSEIDAHTRHKQERYLGGCMWRTQPTSKLVEFRLTADRLSVQLLMD